MALLFAQAHPIKALEIFGLRLFEREEPEEMVIGTPQAYSVEFVVVGDEVEEDKLKEVSELWSERERPASGAAGLIARARGDYRRLLDALYAQARYGPDISITINGIEADDLPPDTELADPAVVRIAIDAGPLFHFGEARIVNPAPPPFHRRDRVPDLVAQGFRPGERAASSTIIEAGLLTEEAWRQQGHPKARIVDQRIIAAHDSSTIDATLTMDPGPYAVFGPVSVTGTERMDAAYVAWMTGLPEGQEFDPDDMKEARDRLSRLDVFRSLRVQEAEEVGQDGTLPIDVIVQERPLRRIGVGGSYSTVDGLGLEAFWLHRNLFGRAERLRIEGRVAGIGETLDPAELTYRLGATFTRPGIYTPDTDFSAALIGEREVLDLYTRNSILGELGISHRFSEEVTARLLANASYGNFDDDFGEREFITAGFLGGIAYDSRNDRADATSGIFAELTVEPFYEFKYGNAVARIVAEARAYHSVDEDGRFVLAGRLKMGSIFDAPLDEIPPDRLFLAGGGGSVRGYGYRNIAVAVPGGMVGGRSLVELSGELRVRVTPSIGLIGFVDAGYVDDRAIPDFSQDLRIGVGAGLRYFTGFGPIRLDVATPLDPGPDDPSVAVYVGIGQAF